MDGFSTHRSRLVLVYLALLMPVAGYGALRALSSDANDAPASSSDSSAVRHRYERFREAFGPPDDIVASWEGCRIDEPRLDQLMARLRENLAFRNPDGEWLFAHAKCGREAVRQLTVSPTSLSFDEAADRLQGTLVGPDGRTTCVSVAFTSEGRDRRAELIDEFQRSVSETCAVPREEQHLTGPAIEKNSLDAANHFSLNRLALPSLLGLLVVACFWLRSIRLGIFVCGIALYAQGAVLAVMYYGDATTGTLRFLLPPLIQVLAVIGGLRLASHYSEALRQHDPEQALGEALRRGWLPVLSLFIAAGIGMATWMTAEDSVACTFGTYSSAGLLMVAGLSFGFLPGLLTLWPGSSRNAKVADGKPESFGSRLGARSFGLLERGHIFVVVGCLLLMIAGGVGLREFSTSRRLDARFAGNGHLAEDAAWLEEHVAPLLPFEVIFTFDENCRLSPQQRMSILWRIDQATREMEEIGGTSTAIDFLPRLPSRDSLPPNQYAAIVDRVLRASRPTFIASRRLSTANQAEEWRFTARTSALGGIPLADSLARLQERIEPLLRDDVGNELAGVSANVTGEASLVHATQQRLRADLIRSFSISCVLIAIPMTVAHAGVIAGLLAMIPCLFPVLVAFGTLGWLNLSADLGAVLAAGVTLGIAADGARRFVASVLRESGQGASRSDAVRTAYGKCGATILQSSLICGVGLGAYLVSDFLPVRHFAGTIVVLVALATIGNLVFLPAILLGPVGRWISVGGNVSTGASSRGRETGGKSQPTRDSGQRNAA